MSGPFPLRKAARGQAAAHKAATAYDAHLRPGITPALPTHLLLAAKRHIVSIQGRRGAGTPILGRMVPLAPRLAPIHGRGPGHQAGLRRAPAAGACEGKEAAHMHFHTIGGHRPRDKRAAPAA